MQKIQKLINAMRNKKGVKIFMHEIIQEQVKTKVILVGLNTGEYNAEISMQELA